MAQQAVRIAREDDWEGHQAHEDAILELATIPTFVNDALSDCCDALVAAFVAGKPVQPILEAACRAKAEQEIEDADDLLTYGPEDDVPTERVLKTWRAYQRKYGPHPAAVLCAAVDAQGGAK